MMGAWWIWPVALMVYVLFRLWYDNWRGPLNAQELEKFLEMAAATPDGQLHRPRSAAHFSRK